MKRKKAGRKTRKTPPAASAKPLRPPFKGPVLGRIVDLKNGTSRPAVPADFANARERFPILPPGELFVLEEPAPGKLRVAKRFAVREIPLPPDFDEAVEHYVGHVSHGVCGEIVSEFDGSEKLEAIHQRLAALIREGVQAAFQNGFYLALIHHSADLKTTAKAVPLLKGMERGRRAGADTNRQKAEPGRAAARKRFRELRKSGFSKTNAREVIEQETGKSFRQIQRDTADLS